MAHRDIVVIGASTGGLHALIELLQPLPVSVDAAVFVVIHTAPEGSGLLPGILERAGAWRASFARDREPIEHGRIYLGHP